jgi:hypothetical protein
LRGARVWHDTSLLPPSSGSLSVAPDAPRVPEEQPDLAHERQRLLVKQQRLRARDSISMRCEAHAAAKRRAAFALPRLPVRAVRLQRGANRA